MSKISGKTRYESFQEWHKWIQSKSAAFRKKKKVNPSEWLQDYGYNKE